MTEPIQTSNPWATLRDAVAACRELMIIAAVAACLLMPSRVQQFLSEAGIRSVAGVQFDARKFKDAQAEMMVAQTDLQTIQETLNQLGQAFQELDSTASVARTRSLNGLEPGLSGSLLAEANLSSATLAANRIRTLLKNAQSQSQQVQSRLEHADQLTRQSLPSQVLVAPEVLFGRSAQVPRTLPPQTR
jgi:Sec-independent protein translocase protein TatA